MIFNDIELLYMKFVNHPLLSGVEINFSQDYRIKCNDNKNIYIYKTKNHNLFKNNIVNFNIIVGKNGCGKTTIMNTIFNNMDFRLMDNDDIIIIIRKYIDEKNYEIYSNKELCKSLDSEEINIKCNRKNFPLMIIPLKDRENDYIQETYNRIYIADFIDYSISNSANKNEDEYALNYSPLHLIDFPNEFLNTRVKTPIAPTINSFKIINRILEIDFLNKSNSKYIRENIQMPDCINISLFMVITRLKRYIEEYGEIYKDEKMININLKKQGKDDIYVLWYTYVFSAVMCTLDLSNYAIYDEKLLKNEKYKNFDNEQIRKFKNECIKQFENKIEEIRKKFIEGNESLNQIKRNINSIIEKCKISNFYTEITFKDNEDCFLMKEKIEEIFNSYNEIIQIRNKRNEYILNLTEASEFLKNYLLLTNKINNNKYYLGRELTPGNITYNKNGKEFCFSSGESALIRYFTYINLGVEKIKENNKNKILINILMDEPTNSMHPKMQKEFIKAFNDYLQDLGEDKKCRFNVLITTHSPIITSELTRNHVIYLKKEDDNSIVSLKQEEKPKTFAQNIYELYREAFYVNDGLIGEFADEILVNLYKSISNREYINGENIYGSEKIDFLIGEIGEPILKKKMINSLNNKIYTLINNIKQCNELDEETKKNIIEIINKNNR